VVVPECSASCQFWHGLPRYVGDLIENGIVYRLWRCNGCGCEFRTLAN